jgi:hypothetical protein
VQLRNESVPYGGCTHTVEKSKLGGGREGREAVSCSGPGSVLSKM